MAIQKERRQTQKNPPKGQEVVYTQAKPFHIRRLLLHLLTVFALVLAVFMGLSVFFKVDRIEVTGANKHSADAVAAASGIENGDSLFFFGRASAYSRIKKELAYVKDVRFGIELPGTVKILIEEVPVVYAIQDTQGIWWMMDSDGKITEQGDSASVRDCTHIVGIYLQNPQVGQAAVAAEPKTEPPAEGEEEQPPAVSYEADKLKAALAITKQLEANEILGKVTEVDVADHQELTLQYGTRFLVELGDVSQMDYKIALVKAAVEQVASQWTGILDVTLQTIKDGIQFRPFED